ncbi:MAG: sugar ABC transporter substrate-binding protein [Boseongicola sp. SB0677_bin_26]|nr:sugar ABC transporter substrate-binding protein [Boseongicola sp. SB0665_bin_10]MYG28515.1 sugar ABC transporter substrate-binding protein [Boseongicola sp. SB0677_bin_26]
MMLRRMFIAAAALAVFALSPPAAKAESMRIAYLSPSFDISDAWERVFWSMQGRLEELGVDFEVQQLAVASHVDHAGQLAQVESVIAGGVDYVFLGPTEFEAAIPALRKLKQAGVPTVVYNFTTPHEDESARAMSYIAFAHYPGGVKSGEWAAEQLGGKGKVLILRGAPGVVSDERGGGFLSVVEQYPDIEVVMGPYTDFDRAKAYDAAQNMLAAHPDINLIYGMSTTIGLGAAQVVRQMGKSEEIRTMGFGGTGDEITAMKEGWLTASVLRPIDDSGVAVADAFVAHSKGEEVPLVWGGSFVMVDRWSDTDEILEYANRYSRPKMGR